LSETNTKFISAAVAAAAAARSCQFPHRRSEPRAIAEFCQPLTSRERARRELVDQSVIID